MWFNHYVNYMWTQLLEMSRTINIQGNPWGFLTPTLLHQIVIECADIADARRITELLDLS